MVVADAGTNPDSVLPEAEHVIHAARWGISLLGVAMANWGKKGSAARVKTIEQHEHIDSEESDVSGISDISAVTLDGNLKACKLWIFLASPTRYWSTM